MLQFFSFWIPMLLCYNVIKSSKAVVVLSYEEYLDFHGEKFCDRQDPAAADFFARMCIRLAEKDTITNYDVEKLRRTASACQDGTLFLYSNVEKTFKMVGDKVLRCQYIVGKRNHTVKAFGRGSGLKDAMLYVPNNSGLWEADSTRPGFLNDV